MNEPGETAKLRTRRRLIGSAAAAGVWFPARPAAQTIPDTTPAPTLAGTGARLLTQFVDDVLKGRSVEHLDSITHPQIEYPTGQMVGVDGFREVWIRDAAQRGALNMIDEYQARVILGDEQWGLAYLVYTVRTDNNDIAGIWHLAYVARVADGLIGTLDVVINEQELE